MIDLHCHILHGIDDGPSDIEASVAMAGIAVSDGITHIVATPHFRYGEEAGAGNFERSLKTLRDAVNERGLSLELSGGADIRLTYELLEGLAKKDVPTIKGSRYFLLELPDLMPPNLDKFLFAAGLEGYVPIITHPERNYSLIMSPEKTEALRDSGALFQLTAMSITGGFGYQIKLFSEHLLKRGFVDFVASDAHDPVYRTPVLSEAYRQVAHMLKGYEAERLFIENPAAVLENGEIRKG